MKRRLLLTLSLLALFAFAGTQNAEAQCKRVSLIGEFSDWADDHFLERDPEQPALFSTIITFAVQDTGDNATVEMKFREDADWAVNWGSDEFPTGTATQDGADIPVPPGTYLVTFNCETGAYSYTSTCGQVSMIGEFNGWSDDVLMERDEDNIDQWVGYITFNADDDNDPVDTMVEMKFRENMDWTVNWGGDGFPGGVATRDGANIKVPLGSYKVVFNCSTLEYSFEETCGAVGLIGEMTNWAEDISMERDEANPDMWTAVIEIDLEDDINNNDSIIEMKFRQNMDWTVNWGAADFPAGTATRDGANILVPLEFDGSISTTYVVEFNCATGEYSFTSTCGDVSLIGGFVDWSADIGLNRDEADPDAWTLTRSFPNDTEGKFRENENWDINWGGDGWPSGVATLGGPNIPITAGTYDIAFNCASGEYSFEENADVCGDIGIIGDFNMFGDDGSGIPTDVWMVRDPDVPSNFTLTYNFTASTNLLFRENADILFNDVWGGNTFPAGTGIMDPGAFIEVPGGQYRITFNCNSGDYSFERLGSSVSAPQVFALTVDGVADETDWDLNQNVSNIVDGEAGDDPNDANFGVAYNEEKLFIAVQVFDGELVDGDSTAASDHVHIFVDGNKNGGAYDDSDVYFTVDYGGNVEIVAGNSAAVIDAVVNPLATGYMVEASVDWAELAVVPMPGSPIGFDVGVTDVDNGGYQSVSMWNGNLGNIANASALGDLLFGDLACGRVSLYNSEIGDVPLYNPTDFPNDYVGTYALENAADVVFRKDGQDVVSWGGTDFPTGTAVLDANPIPAEAGNWRVAFNCLTGDYSFAEVTDPVADADYTDAVVVLDGDLGEYSLDYGLDAGVVDGSGPIENGFSWGAVWNEDGLYIGVEVIDDEIVGSDGNPWEHDGIEMYFDGNHDQDGAYDTDWDNQFVFDVTNDTTFWDKGGEFTAVDDLESILVETANGYNLEFFMPWSHWGIKPGRNRSIGFSIGMNERDEGDAARAYQAVWAGEGTQWNNTMELGDLRLTGGPLVKVIENFYNESVTIFPNPISTGSALFIATSGEIFTGDTRLEIFNSVGQVVYTEKLSLEGHDKTLVNTGDLRAGHYYVHLISADGKRALKKLIIQ